MKTNCLNRREFLAACGAFAAFELTGAPSGEAPLVRFGVLTDCHYADKNMMPSGGSWKNGDMYYRDSLVKMRRFVSVMNERKPDFVIELGDFKDMSAHPTKEETFGFLETIEAEYAKFEGPRYHVLGNHDMDIFTKEEFFSRITNDGVRPTCGHYAFERGGVRFLALDSCYAEDRDDRPFANENWRGNGIFIPPAERAWLKAELAAAGNRPVIAFCHHRLDPNTQPGTAVHNASEIRSIFKEAGNVRAVFTGHVHTGGSCNMDGMLYYSLRGMVIGPSDVANSFAEVGVYPSGHVSITHFVNG